MTRRRRKYGAAAYLYRARNEDGRLLYIGISGNALVRLQEHLSSCMPWAGYIATVEIERHRSISAALAAETAAIRAENPSFNKMSAGRPKRECDICGQTRPCIASNCALKRFIPVPIIRGENIRCM